jgi:hypothetical protein
MNSISFVVYCLMIAGFARALATALYYFAHTPSPVLTELALTQLGSLLPP